jgi:citrate lyase subunit beta/citryl-CoA lyase
MNSRPRRLRRVQLAVPGSSEKMLRKAAESKADYVFCDLEDAVAPAAKAGARDTIAWALNNLDWQKKTRCVRVNDVSTEWCHDDIIQVVQNAGKNLDTLILAKARDAADVLFVDRLLGQLEAKLRLPHRIGLEVLIEEAAALQSVEAIAAATPRLEALIFGMGDYSASQGIDSRALTGGSDYPGDIFHYARFRIAMAARAAGLEAIDGPFPDFRNEEGFRTEARRARAVGMTGKWAIHPAQIELALEEFTPTAADVAQARKIAAAYREAEAQGLGSCQVDGVMVDLAVLRLVQGTLDRAELIGI